MGVTEEAGSSADMPKQDLTLFHRSKDTWKLQFMRNDR